MTQHIRLTHIDGKLPNLALMKLSHFHKSHGDTVHFSKSVRRNLFEPNYDVVYGSSIFKFSQGRQDLFSTQFPNAIIGGTGTDSHVTVEDLIGTTYENYDYEIYPNYEFSIGFTQRGCRLRCKFCVVPEKEGRPRSINSIHDIWRGREYPKKIVLLDNDFFGQGEQSINDLCKEIVEGGFKISFSQGINIRLIDDNAANWLSKIRYYDNKFTKRRLYTAWDNLKDEKIFFNGVDRLERFGVPPYHLMVYMLVGYRKDETMGEVLYRFNKMVARGIKPYPMVYDNENKQLKAFQRYVIRRYYQFVSWDDYVAGGYSRGQASSRSQLRLPES